MAFSLFLNQTGNQAALKTEADVTKVCWLSQGGKGSLTTVSSLKASLRANCISIRAVTT